MSPITSDDLRAIVVPAARALSSTSNCHAVKRREFIGIPFIVELSRFNGSKRLWFRLRHLP
jgi:hypothetical protein